MKRSPLVAGLCGMSKNKKREDQVEGGGATWPSRRRKDIFFPVIIITRRSSEIKAHRENFIKKFRYAENTALEGCAT
jgi:hypothetical protein